MSAAPGTAKPARASQARQKHIAKPGTAKPGRRLFFALWPDDGLRIELHRVARKAVRLCRGQPVPARNYHLTLAFLGNVAAALFEPIVAAARDVPLPPLVLELDRFGWFPGPQVFWLGPAETPVALAEHAAALWDRMTALGVARDPRTVPSRLNVHLTLCRQVQRLPELPPPEPVTWRAADFVLVESVTDPAGARYEVVARLAGAGAGGR